jgi:hypothetical protein
MTPRTSIRIVFALVGVILGSALVYAAAQFASFGPRSAEPGHPVAALLSDPSLAGRLVFRNTAIGAEYGLVASVSLGDPKGPRIVTKRACDRVYATRQYEICLHTEAQAVTTFHATLFDSRGATIRTWQLPGVPSRTRISADSHLVAQTSFVTGTSYGEHESSTETSISTTNGKDYGDLNAFAFEVDGKPVTAPDRSFWGVTFSSDDNTFYATAALDGTTWLVRGDLAARSLTAISTAAECPSLSPDGTKVAYKKNLSTTGTAHWTLAVRVLATGSETLLPIQPSVDDQAEWLNGTTLLFGLPDGNVVGDSNVWSVPIDGMSAPTMFLKHAWSPSVVR